jgi:hypothetical protein
MRLGGDRRTPEVTGMVVHDSRASAWREIVHVRTRYQRSVHLERDAGVEGSLDGYILTPLVRTLTGRIVDGFRARSPARAFSITGPYGTGKSAFAVFLTDALSPPTHDASQTARSLVAATDASLATSLTDPEGICGPEDGLCPVLATGERRSLDHVLLRALRDFTQRYWGGRGTKPGLVAKIAKAAAAADAGRSHGGTRDVVALFEETAKKVAESKHPGRGLIVVLDEAGKVLEHAAQHPERGDVQLLQELAEAANRSGDAPIVFLVVLHQAFEQYAGRLSLTERSEWAKVQGRFEDLAFQEASHELLRLVGAALDRGKLPGNLRRTLEPLAAQCAGLVTRAGGLDARTREELLSAALPLHPVTALLLGPLFRSRLSQNERSLFAFLASVEPHGFQEFLDGPTGTGKRPVLFMPDALHDYIVASLGSRLHGHLGKQWAQIETVLRRLPEGAVDLDARVLKTIGLLDLFGEAAGITASDATLTAVYGGSTEPEQRALTESLERLRRASLIIFRKFRNAYQIWEGSDLDVDALMRDARGQIDATSTLVQRLSRVAPPRPVVARRHLFETGTFRYFDLRYLDISAFDESVPEVDRNADGALFLVIEPDVATRAKFLHQLGQPLAWTTAGAKPVIVAVPRHVSKFLELGAELAALEWVQTHTPALHEDAVAQREVTTRIAEGERRLRSEVARLLGGAIGCDWVTRDATHEIGSAKDLARLVSDLCDAAYCKAPVLQNELLNRRQISSAAAAARRTLLEAMITHGSVPGLGFEGTPPEVSMYRSVLAAHKLHHERDGGWGFGQPANKKHGSLRPAWDEMLKALSDAQEARLKVPALFERLRRPPFGLKDGVLPVLLVAVLLAHKDEVALYEDGGFLAKLDGVIALRLAETPERFELQRIPVEGLRAELFGRLVRILYLGGKAPEAGILAIVRPLVRAVRDLPEYARTTSTVSPAARAVREVLLHAREPGTVLFTDLPRACGLAAVSVDGDGAAVGGVVESIRAAVRELRMAYPLLLDSVESALRESLGLPAGADEMRASLALRAARLLPACVGDEPAAFLRHAVAEGPRDAWLSALGAHVTGRPPSAWRDHDMDRFYLMLAQLRRKVVAQEELLGGLDAPAASDDSLRLRMSVSQDGQRERVHLIQCDAAARPDVENLRATLRERIGQVSLEVGIVAISRVLEDMSSGAPAPGCR